MSLHEQGFDYSVSGGMCPSREAFLQTIGRALPEKDRNQMAGLVSLLLSGVTVDQSGMRAELRFREGMGEPRIVLGKDCAEVVAGAALIAVVALQNTESPAPPPAPAALAKSRDPLLPVPTERFAPTPVQNSVPADSPQTPRPPPSPPPNQVEPVAAVVVPPSMPAPPNNTPISTPRDSADMPPRQPWRWRAVVGAGIGTNTWLGPRASRLWDGFVELAPDAGVWSLRLGAHWGGAESEPGPRSAHFDYWGGRLTACLRIPKNAETWQASVCNFTSVGSLRARGDEDSELVVANEQRLTWVDTGLALIGATPPAWSRLRLEGQLEGLVPWRRRQFHFENPDEPVFTSPQFAVQARVGVGALFY